MPDEPNRPDAAAVPKTRVDAEPEQISEVFHELVGVKNRFRKLRSFFRTREQIKSGAYLFDHAADELKSKGLMGPLTFNIYSSTLAGTLALALTKIAGLVLPQPPAPLAHVKPLNAVSAQYLKLLPVVDSYLQPFLVPIVFLLMAYCISWGTIRRADPTVTSISSGSINWSGPSRARGRNAFLYFDGAYGFIPQIILATIFVSFRLLIDNLKWYKGGTTVSAFQDEYPQQSIGFSINPVFAAIAFAILAILALTFLYSGYLTYYKFPKLLFTAHGYYRQDKEREGNNGLRRPPWAKYILTALCIIPIVTTLTSLIFAGVGIVLAGFLAVVITVAKETFGLRGL